MARRSVTEWIADNKNILYVIGETYGITDGSMTYPDAIDAEDNALYDSFMETVWAEFNEVHKFPEGQEWKMDEPGQYSTTYKDTEFTVAFSWDEPLVPGDTADTLLDLIMINQLYIDEPNEVVWYRGELTKEWTANPEEFTINEK